MIKKIRFSMMNVKMFLVAIALMPGLSATIFAQDVYIGGQDNSRAVVWKNGTPTYLTAEYGYIHSVVVDNGNVYALGGEEVSGNDGPYTYISKLWKNGTELHVFNNNSSAACVAVSNGNVYVAGQENIGEGFAYDYIGRVWKNGIAETGYTGAVGVGSLFIDGNDIYATGSIYEIDNDVEYAAVWKNGELLYTFASAGGDFSYYYAVSIFVDNGDVYTLCHKGEYMDELYSYQIWKNNTLHYTLASSMYAPSMYISNGDIYVAGAEGGWEPQAKLWINGVSTDLTAPNDMTISYVYATAVAVSNGDVYVTGMAQLIVEDEESYVSYPIALYWKNGTPITLSTSYSYASGIFIVPVAPPVIEHTITASADENGSINPSGAVTVEEGEDQLFTFTANSGYEIDQVLIDGVNDPVAVTAGTYTFTNVTTDHTILVTFRETVGIATITNDQFRIYPNPTSGKLFIESGDLCVKKIEIYDIHARNALSCAFPATTIDISHFPTGIYFVKIATEAGELVRKIIKE
jgi:hypothetical protein